MIVWYMTDWEIKTNFRQAKDRAAQIRIIADMNAVTINAVIAKLLDLGFTDDCLYKVRGIAWVPWTEQEVEKLMTMRANGVKWKDIAMKLNRSPFACQRKEYEVRTGERAK